MHNELISGDELFSIQLNYKWRKLIIGLINNAWFDDLSTISLDNQDLLSALILDLYDDSEVFVPRVIPTLLRADLGTNKTTTSTSFVIITASNLSFTPQTENCMIICHNISIVNSTSAIVEVEVRFNALTGTQNAIAENSGVNGRTVSASAVFEGLDIGVAHDISLYWKVASGTGTIAANTPLIYEVIEYE